MAPEQRILRDLSAGQATACALAGTLGIKPQVIAIILTRLQTEGKVLSTPLGGVLAGTPVYQLPPTP